MNLLTWHGTIVRTGRDGRWLHAPIWPARAENVDLQLDIGADLPALLPDGLVAEPGPQPNTILLRRGETYLRAEDHDPWLQQGLRQNNWREVFLLVEEAVLARLRALVNSAPGERAFSIVSGFQCVSGDRRLPLAGVQKAGDAGLALVAESGEDLVLERAAAPPPELDVRLPLFVPAPEAATAAQTDGEREMLYPPLTLSDADQVWLQRHAAAPVRFGQQVTGWRLRRAEKAFLLDVAGREGAVLTHEGFMPSPGADSLVSVPVSGDGPLSREGDTLFISRRAMDDAPSLPGPCVLVCPATSLDNYYHWVMDSLLPLSLAMPHLPPGARLLFPRAMRRLRDGPGAFRVPDFTDTLREWGLASLPNTEIPGDVSRPETLFWVEAAPDGLPGSALKAARDSLFPERTPEGMRRLLIRRDGRRRVVNLPEIEAALKPHGFATVSLQGVPPDRQAALFRGAQIIVAPHGAELVNLLFCQAGTRVIELSPDAEFRPYYVRMSSKLSLRHAILPCPTATPGFHADLIVDAARLERLLRLSLSVR